MSSMLACSPPHHEENKDHAIRMEANGMGNYIGIGRCMWKEMDEYIGGNKSDRGDRSDEDGCDGHVLPLKEDGYHNEGDGHIAKGLGRAVEKAVASYCLTALQKLCSCDLVVHIIHAFNICYKKENFIQCVVWIR